MEKHCLQCGKKFLKLPTESKKSWESRHKFCSKPCYYISKKEKVLNNVGNIKIGLGRNNIKWNGGMTTLKCIQCSKEYQVKPYRKNTSTFCSLDCVHKGNIGNKGYWTDKKRPDIAQENNWHWKGGMINRDMLVSRRRALEKNAQGTHTIGQWEELKFEFNYMCLCCKKTEPEIKLTEDHIIPLSKGGSNDISNIQPLCRSCNSRKQVDVINYKDLLASNV